MEAILILILIVVFLVVSAILGFVAFVRQLKGSCSRPNSLRIQWLEERVKYLEEKVPPAAADGAEEEEAIHQETRPQEAEKQVEPESPAFREPTAKPPVGADMIHADQPPRAGKSFWQGIEKTVGEKWIAWVGVVVIFLAVAFFIKHAIDMGWLGPTARCTLGVVAGIVMALAGDLCLRRNMRGLGQGLVGGALAVLYLSIFAAFSFYELLPPHVAFVFMIAVTVAGMLLALLHNSLVIAFIAVLGGFLTPVLCRTDRDSRDILFTYIMVLNLGVLCVALFRRWRALDLLAFVGTWLLFGGWYARFYADAMLVPTICWLLVFFAIFLLLPFGYHLRTGLKVPIERFLLGMLNAVTAFGFAFAILHPEHQHLLGFLALGMAVSYLALGRAIRWRTGGARDMLGFLALAMIFLTVAVPLHMGLHGTLIVWVAQAVALLYLGYRFTYLPVRLGGFVVFCVVVIRFFTIHWPLHEMDFVLFWNASFGTALFLPLGGAVFAWLHRRRRSGDILDGVSQRIVGTGSCLLLLLILNSEIGLWMVQRGTVTEEFRGEYFANLTRSLIWAVGSLLMLAGGVRWRSYAMRLVGLLPLAIALIYSFITYADPLPGHVLFFNLRFAVSVVWVAAAFLWALRLRRLEKKWEWIPGEVLGWIAIFILWLYLSMEVWQFFREYVSPADRARWAALMSLSVTWGAYAIALLTIGFLRKRRSLRLVALGLFGVTGLKLVFVDMAGVEDIYRIISFLAIGVLMVGASYLYHLAERRIMRRGDE